jgi:hypothetical protein
VTTVAKNMSVSVWTRLMLMIYGTDGVINLIRDRADDPNDVDNKVEVVNLSTISITAKHD